MSLLCALVVILIVFAGVMHWVASNSAQTRKNEIFTSSEAAAEGASELIFAHMDRDFIYGSINTSSNYYSAFLPSTNNWPVQYTFNANVTMGSQITNLSYLGSQYTNLLGWPETNTVTVTATPNGQMYQVPSTISQSFIFASIPAFQFAIFYNINLEIDPGSTMPIDGAVFSNAGIWSGTANVSYSSTVEAVGQVTTSGDDPFVSDNAKSDSGTPQSNFKFSGPPAQPESNVNPLVLPIGASSNGTNDTSTDVQAIIAIPPASVCPPNNPAVDYAQTNLVYDFNAASLIVSNWYWGSNGVAPWSNNFTVYLQDSAQTPYNVQSNGMAMNWIMLTNDYFIISNRNAHYAGLWPTTASPQSTNWVPNFQFTQDVSSIKWINTQAADGPIGTNCVWYAGFSFLTNATFYDYREKATVRAVQIDVGNLGAWITNCAPNGGSNWNQELCLDLNHGINSMYVYNAVPLIGQRQLPAVRVMDGALLPSSTCINSGGEPTFTSGFSFVTPQPMYVWGNYNVETDGKSATLNSHNTANTYPAALLADSITVLSQNWQDSYGPSTYTRNAANDTLNAACLEGIVPSVGKNYSGGVENFMRLLENWSGDKLTYNGSIMVMFPSQYATNLWQETGVGSGTPNVYNPPERDWGFDTNFLIQADLPPLTPQFRGVVRNAWTGY